jgi:TRAP-type uncharacterized transport system substrate-binding protein
MHSSLFPFHLILFSLLASLISASPARAQNDVGFVFSSGTEGGFYHEVANEFVRLLSGEHRVARNQTSGGSAQNLLQLATPGNPVNVTLAQADAVRFFLDEHPDFWSELVVVEDLGRECVALITGAEAGIASVADLKTGQFGSLVTPGMGSGAAVTFEYMSRMDPAYRKTDIVYRKPMDAIRQIESKGEGNIAAIMLVNRPEALTPALERVLENPGQLKIAPIRAEDVQNGVLPDGSSVYSFEKVEVGSGSGSPIRYETMCTRALMLTSSSKLDEPARQELAQRVVEWQARKTRDND